MTFALTFQDISPVDCTLQFAYLPWDSEIYGFPFYELKCKDTDPDVISQNLPSWLSSIASTNRCLVYTKIPTEATDLARVLTQNGFYPVETLLNLALPLAKHTSLFPQKLGRLHLRLADESDLPYISAIACQAFQADRLHLDSYLPPEKANQRYAQWVERGFRDGEPILIYEDTRSLEVVGFVHIRETQPKIIQLSLGAVKPAYRHTGFGGLMFQDVLMYCKEKGYQLATTWSSVNNPEMVNLLMRLGFAIRDKVATLHWHLATAS